MSKLPEHVQRRRLRWQRSRSLSSKEQIKDLWVFALKGVGGRGLCDLTQTSGHSLLLLHLSPLMFSLGFSFLSVLKRGQIANLNSL